MRPSFFMLLAFSQYRTFTSIETFFYDLNVDPIEAENLDPTQSEHVGIYNTLVNRSSYWSNYVVTFDQEDGTTKKSTWKKNRGVTSWATNVNFTAPDIPKTYNYSGAPNIVFVLVDDWVSN